MLLLTVHADEFTPLTRRWVRDGSPFAECVREQAAAWPRSPSRDVVTVGVDGLRFGEGDRFLRNAAAGAMADLDAERSLWNSFEATLIEALLHAIGVLKTDMQGYDFSAIKGAGDSLKRVRYTYRWC